VAESFVGHVRSAPSPRDAQLLRDALEAARQHEGAA